MRDLFSRRPQWWEHPEILTLLLCSLCLREDWTSGGHRNHRQCDGKGLGGIIWSLTASRKEKVEFSGRESAGSCDLMLVLVPPPSSSISSHRSRVPILGRPGQNSSPCGSSAEPPALALSCLPPDTRRSHTGSWNDNFPVAVAFVCGVACLFADKKITVVLKNSTKIAPFCLLLQGFSSLFHCRSVFLALSSHFPADFAAAWCGVNLAAAGSSVLPGTRRDLCAPGPWAVPPRRWRCVGCWACSSVH